MKTALVTGAYRGLGFEVARQLSERGFRVILTARRADAGIAAAAKLKNGSFLEIDITDSGSVARAARTSCRRARFSSLPVSRRPRSASTST